MDNELGRVVPMTSSLTDPLDYALLYAARGWPVLPTHTMLEHGGCSCGEIGCRTPGKHPRTRHGVDDASTEAATIRAWWRAWPDANIGIACGQASGLLIVDVDPRNGGELTLDELEATHGEIPRDAIVETGGGGLHIYLRHPAHAVAGKLGPGIDVKSDGGYVIAPPSMHELGTRYGWYDDVDETLGAQVGVAPTWLSERLKRDAMPAPVGESVGAFTPPEVALSAHEIDQILSALPFIDADDRDHWITVGMALHAVGAGTQGWMLWEEWSRQSEKFDAKDQARVWRSFRHDKAAEITLGSLFHLARKAGWVRVSEPVEDVAPVAPKPAPATMAERETPLELLTIPGALGDMVGWINETAAQPQPLFAVQAALALGSVAAARLYQTQMNNYSSLYFLCVSASGTGKEHGKRAIEKVLDFSGHNDLIGPDGYASGAGVFSSLHYQPAHIACIDEMGKLFASQNGQQHRIDAMNELVQMFGRLDGVLRPKGYSMTGLSREQVQELQGRVVRRPAMSIYGMTTPDSFLSALTESSIKDGLLPRFIVAVSKEPRIATMPKPITDPPDSVADWVKQLRQPMDKGPLASAHHGDPAVAPDPVEISVTDEAKDVFMRLKQRVVELQYELDDEPGMVDLPNRWAESAARLSMIIALSRDPNRRIVRGEDMEWAVRYVEYHGRNFLALARDRLGLNDFATLVSDLAVLIGKHSKGMTRREIGQYSRRFRNLKPREQDEVLQALLNNGDATQDKRQGARGRAVQVFKRSQT